MLVTVVRWPFHSSQEGIRHFHPDEAPAYSTGSPSDVVATAAHGSQSGDVEEVSKVARIKRQTMYEIMQLINKRISALVSEAIEWKQHQQKI